jgi:anti-sigma B factor antagonist
VLLATLKRLKKDGGTLRIACGSPQILEVFTMAGFHRIFSISPDEAAALAGFPAGS